MRARTLTLRRAALVVVCLAFRVGVAAAVSAATSFSQTASTGPTAGSTAPSAGPLNPLRTENTATIPSPPAAAPSLGPREVDVEVAPLAAAQRELTAMKAARDASALPTRALPSIAAPELPSTDPLPAAAALRAPRPSGQTAGSPNWLIEAMQKRDATDPRNPEMTAERGRRRLPTSAPDLRASAANPTRRDSEFAVRDSAPSSPTARGGNPNTDGSTVARRNNPLQPFLADWMTPQDYALLQPQGSRRDAAGGRLTDVYGALPNAAENPRVGADAFAGGASSFARSGEYARLESARAGGAASSSPAENPFLIALEAPAGLVGSNAHTQPSPPPPSFSSAPAVMPVAPLSPPPNAASSSRLPEFAKPASDERYFKPLKRF